MGFKPLSSTIAALAVLFSANAGNAALAQEQPSTPPIVDDVDLGEVDEALRATLQSIQRGDYLRDDFAADEYISPQKTGPVYGPTNDFNDNGDSSGLVGIIRSGGVRIYEFQPEGRETLSLERARGNGVQIQYEFRF